MNFAENWEEEDEDYSSASAGAFWAEEKGSPIDELLTQSSDPAPLELFLQEPMLLQEITGHHVDLLRYLEQRIDQLLDYALLGRGLNGEGGGENDEAYSQMAFEILHANTLELSSAILRSPQHLDRLFQLVRLPAGQPTNRLAGNFHMLLATLCTRDARALLRHASSSSSAVGASSSASSPSASSSSTTSSSGTEDSEVVPSSEPLILGFIRHLGTPAITSALICLIQVAFQLDGEQEDSHHSQRSHHDAYSFSNHNHTIEEKEDFSVWQGGRGTAQLVLRHLPECPHNAAELLTELYGLAAARAQEAQDRALVSSFAALVDEEDGSSTSPTLAAEQPASSSSSSSSSDAATGLSWTVELVRAMCEQVVVADGDTTDETCRVALLTVLHEVVQAYTVDFSSGNLVSAASASATSADSSANASSSSPVGQQELEALLKELPRLNAFFASQEQQEVESSSSSLGMARLVYSSLVCEFVLCGHQALAGEVPAQCIELVVDWFFRYERNTLLHCSVMRALRAILSGTKPSGTGAEQHHPVQISPSSSGGGSSRRRGSSLLFEGGGGGLTLQQEQAAQAAQAERQATLRALEPLQEVLLSPQGQCRLLSRVLHQANQHALLLDSDSSRSRTRPPRPGFLGHVRVLATDLSNLIEAQMVGEGELVGSNNSSCAFDALRECGAVQEWHDFVAGALAECNARVRRPLGVSPVLLQSASEQQQEVKRTAAVGPRRGVANASTAKSRSTFVGGGPSSLENAEELRRLSALLHPEGEDDDEEDEEVEDDEDDDEEEDGDVVMQRYYARSQALMAVAAAQSASATTHDPFAVQEEELEGESGAIWSSAAAQFASEDDDAWGAEEEDEGPANNSQFVVQHEDEEEEEEEAPKPRKTVNSSPMAAQKKRGAQELLLGVSPSWVTSGFDHADDDDDEHEGDGADKDKQQQQQTVQEPSAKRAPPPS